jgi:hypothetical protein
VERYFNDFILSNTSAISRVRAKVAEVFGSICDATRKTLALRRLPIVSFLGYNSRALLSFAQLVNKLDNFGNLQALLPLHSRCAPGVYASWLEVSEFNIKFIENIRGFGSC